MISLLCAVRAARMELCCDPPGRNVLRRRQLLRAAKFPSLHVPQSAFRSVNREVLSHPVNLAGNVGGKKTALDLMFCEHLFKQLSRQFFIYVSNCIDQQMGAIGLHASRPIRATFGSAARHRCRYRPACCRTSRSRISVSSSWSLVIGGGEGAGS